MNAIKRFWCLLTSHRPIETRHRRLGNWYVVHLHCADCGTVWTEVRRVEFTWTIRRNTVGQVVPGPTRRAG